MSRCRQAKLTREQVVARLISDDFLDELAEFVMAMIRESEAAHRRAVETLRDVEWGPEPIVDTSVCAWCLREKREGHARRCHVRTALTEKP